MCYKKLIANQSANISYEYPFEIVLEKSILSVQPQKDVLCYVNKTSNNTNNLTFKLDNNSSSGENCYCEFLLYKK